MKSFIASLVLVISLTAVAFCAPGDKHKPQWQKMGRGILIYGTVERQGFYTLTDRPTKLFELVISAGVTEGLHVILHRPDPDGKAQSSLEIEMSRLKDDGDIELQANDVIEVK